MKKIAGCLLALIIYTSICAQHPDTSYTRYWIDIDTILYNQSLTKTALAKVNNIYALAQKDNRQVQVIKALIYRMSLEKEITEDDINKEVKVLQKEINSTDGAAAKAVLMSLLAEKYQRCYEQHRWDFYNRTKTDQKQEDIATWTADDLQKEITNWYAQSLKNKQVLQQQPLANYNAIVESYSPNFYRPTVYDLLAHRALDYFKNDNYYLNQPAYVFTVSQPQAMGFISDFTGYTFTTADSASNKWKALLMLQDLVRFHEQRKDTAALIDVNLERISYVNNHGTFDNKDSLYYAAVKETAERFKASRHAAEAWYLLAQYHADKAQQYANDRSKTPVRFSYVKALSLIRPFLSITDSTKGHTHLYNLYQSIVSKALSLEAEEVNVPEKPFRILVRYRNADTLYYRIIRSTKAIEDTLAKHPNYYSGDKKDLFQVVADLPFILHNKIVLPLSGDYQLSGTEVKMDGLPVGEYYILASLSSTFADSANLAWQHIYVSNISFVNNGQHLFVLDRTTGQPLANAKVQVWQENESNHLSKQENYKTDINGYAVIKANKERERQIEFEIISNNDYLFIKDENRISLLEADEASDKEPAKDATTIFYFTDRCIYRPGQKVFFKIILLTNNPKTGKIKIYQPSKSNHFYIFLRDKNNVNIDSVLVKINEYGSFAASFALPSNRFSGQFSLWTDSQFGEKGGVFSVEEYKRPTFEVTLNKPTGEYKVGDSLMVSGTAKAYAGNAADGAVIKYSVTRRERYLYSWLWDDGYRPGSNETTIAVGETKTDDAGKFNIGFIAKGDNEVSKQSLPVFDYEVKTDVTDNSGETRNQQLTVSVAYHSLNIKVSTKEISNADSLNTIFVSTTNIAGDNQAAMVKLEIIPLKKPDVPFRKRLWVKPDTSLYTQSQYRQWFPNDVYANEDDKKTWQKMSPAFSKVLDTKDSGSVIVPKGLLKSGWYIVTAAAKDKQGNEIKDEQYVQLYSVKPGSFNGNDYFFTSVVSNSVMPGEAATFLLGSNAPDVYVIQETQHKPGKKITAIRSEFTFHAVSENVKTVQVLPGKGDENGMTVNFIMVKDNRVYTWSQQVLRERKNNKLNVEVISYRNKLEPGSNETWTIKVTGNNKDQHAAEVLTSMYDASLDQFNINIWEKPFLDRTLFTGIDWSDFIGFSSSSSNENFIKTLSKVDWSTYPEIFSQIPKRRSSLKAQYDTVLVSDLSGDVLSYEIRERNALNFAQGNGSAAFVLAAPHPNFRKPIETNKWTTPKIVADEKVTPNKWYPSSFSGLGLASCRQEIYWMLTIATGFSSRRQRWTKRLTSFRKSCAKKLSPCSTTKPRSDALLSAVSH